MRKEKRRPARRRDDIASLAALKRRATVLRQLWFFELHSLDANCGFGPTKLWLCVN
jgi:hypothetical protein